MCVCVHTCAYICPSMHACAQLPRPSIDHQLSDKSSYPNCRNDGVCVCLLERSAVQQYMYFIVFGVEVTR